jgi:hypothetical protein
MSLRVEPRPLAALSVVDRFMCLIQVAMLVFIAWLLFCHVSNVEELIAYLG